MREFSTQGAKATATASPPPALGNLRRRAQTRLSATSRFGRLVRFGAVGISGLVVNLLALALLLLAHLGSRVVGGEALSAIIATQCAVAWNFGLTERWVFKGQRGHWVRRLLPFWVLSCGALIAQLPLAAALQPLLNGSYLLATAMAVCLLMTTRFAVCDLWLYRRRATAGHRARPIPDPVP